MSLHSCHQNHISLYIKCKTNAIIVTTYLISHWLCGIDCLDCASVYCLLLCFIPTKDFVNTSHMQSEAEIHNLFLAWLWDSFPGVMLVQCISTCTDCKDEITCLVYWRFLCDDSASGHTSAFYWCSAEILPQGSVLIILIKMLLWWGIKLVAVDTLMPLISFSYFDPLNGRKHLKICKRESNIKKYKNRISESLLAIQTIRFQL